MSMRAISFIENTCENLPPRLPLSNSMMDIDFDTRKKSNTVPILKRKVKKRRNSVSSERRCSRTDGFGTIIDHKKKHKIQMMESPKVIVVENFKMYNEAYEPNYKNFYSSEEYSPQKKKKMDRCSACNIF